MKQEPVAWMNVNHDINNDEPFSFIKTVLHNEPLYTTPQLKELNDEEILNVIEQFRNDKNLSFKEYENTYMDGWLDACNEIYSAVFAILKKASEK